MKIELRRISHNARMSEETPCFTADLYVDGTKRGTVSNRGTGGSHDFSDWNAEKEINEYAKALPPNQFPAEWCKNGESRDYPQTAETIVGDLLDKHLEEKQKKAEVNKLIKAMKTKTLFRKAGSKPGEYAYFPGTDQRILDHIAKKYPDATVITPDNLHLILDADDKVEA
jgi:hypothetical protein